MTGFLMVNHTALHIFFKDFCKKVAEKFGGTK